MIKTTLYQNNNSTSPQLIIYIEIASCIVDILDSACHGLYRMRPKTAKTGLPFAITPAISPKAATPAIINRVGGKH